MFSTNWERNPLAEITDLVQNHRLCDQKQKNNCQKQNFENQQTQKAIKPNNSEVTQGKTDT